MSNWERAPFEKLYAEPSKNGLTRPKRVRGSGYKMINMGELFAYDRIRNPPMELVPMNEKEIEKFRVKIGDLLFARQSLVAAGAGKCSIVIEAPELTTFESHLIRVRLDKQNAVPQFYFYYFNSPQGKGNVQSLVMQVAAAGIRGSELAKLIVPCPPLPIQRKIAAILSAYDDLIENNLRRIKILEEMAQALYREWFVKFRFPGHEKVKMVDSELGKVPEGWEVKTLQEMCIVVMGQSPKSEYYNETGEGLPFHQGVRDFGDRFPTHRIYCTILKRIAEKGDILFSVRAPVGRINTANAKMVVGRGLCAIRSRTGSQSFIFQQLKEMFQKEDIMGGGTIFKAVTKSDMLNLKMISPASPITDDFEAKMKHLFRNFEIMYLKNDNLRRTRDLLLPRLVSGAVDVSDLQIDTGGVA